MSLASKLPMQLGNGLAQSLGNATKCRHDALDSCVATVPQLTSRGEEDMNSGRESFHDAKVLQTLAVGVGCQICCQSRGSSHTAHCHPITNRGHQYNRQITF